MAASFEITNIESLPENWDSPQIYTSFTNFKVTTKNIDKDEMIDIVIKSGLNDNLDIIESYSRKIDDSNETINFDIPPVDLTDSESINISELDISQGDSININISVELKYNNNVLENIDKTINIPIIGSKSYIYQGGDSNKWSEISEDGGFIKFDENHINLVADAEGSNIYADDVSSARREIESKSEIDFTEYNKLYGQYKFTTSRRDDNVGNDETGYFQMRLENNGISDTNSIDVEDEHEYDGKDNKRTAKRDGIFEIDISNIDSDYIKIGARAHSSNSGYTDGLIYEIWME